MLMCVMMCVRERGLVTVWEYVEEGVCEGMCLCVCVCVRERERV